jgi:hypothetical protein
MPDGAILSRAPDLVPAEFRGKARALNRRLRVQDMEVLRLARDVAARVMQRKAERRTPIRKEWLPDIAREWRLKLETFGRLAFEIEKSRKGWTLLDARIAASRVHLDGWPDDIVDPGLRAVVIHFYCGVDDVRLRTETLAIVGLHPVARWFHRTRGDDDGLLADLQRLAIAHDDLVGGKHFRLDVPNGAWVGDVRDGARKTLAMRTFLAEGMK